DDRALPAWDMVKSSEVTKKILIGLELFLGIVGALTLLIGGVGVANIMYAVVKERTREIGVKMALGAKQRWIIAPFVLEAVVYTFIGGALGIIIATLLVSLTSFINLEINKGEMVAIVGPSGSGKSTLMTLIGCLYTPTSGVYEIGGQAVSGVTRDELAEIRNRRVGFVFQAFNLLPPITALENVELPMLFGGVKPHERRERASQLLDRVGLGDRLDHKPTELSGGQMQRVAIARALAMEPDIVLADEPTGNLDSSAGGDIMSIFTDLWQQGRTLVIITHDPALARRASRVVEIHDGRITSDHATNAAA